MNLKPYAGYWEIPNYFPRLFFQLKKIILFFVTFAKPKITEIMKTLFFICLSIISTVSGYSQWLWTHDTSLVNEAGGAQSVAPDNFGNVYCTAERNLFLHNANTGAIKWTLHIGSNYYLNEIVTDGAGYAYHYCLDLGYEIRKVDSFGNIIWYTAGVPVSGTLSPMKISCDEPGYLYVSGYYASPFVVAGPDTIRCSDTYHSYFVKYDTAGHVNWWQTVSASKNVVVYGVAGDVTGNYYIYGLADTSAIKIGDTAVTLANPGENIFVAKCNSAHQLLWITSNSHAHGYFYVNQRDYQMNIDGSGNVYITGLYTQDGNIGAIPLVYSHSGGKDVFIAKFDSFTGNVIWAKTGNSGVYSYRVFSLATNKNGNSYLNFASGTTASFGGSTFNFTGTGSRTVLTAIAGIDSSGSVLWGTILGGNSGDDECGVGIDRLGNGYVSGDYIDSCDFGALSLHTGAAAGTEEYFAAKFSSCFPYESLGIQSINSGLYNLTIHPNPAIGECVLSYTGQMNQSVIANIFDLSGRLISRVNIQPSGTAIRVSDWTPGIYICRFMADDVNIANKKLVIER